MIAPLSYRTTSPTPRSHVGGIPVLLPRRAQWHHSKPVVCGVQRPSGEAIQASGARFPPGMQLGKDASFDTVSRACGRVALSTHACVICQRHDIPKLSAMVTLLSFRTLTEKDGWRFTLSYQYICIPLPTPTPTPLVLRSFDKDYQSASKCLNAFIL